MINAWDIPMKREPWTENESFPDVPSKMPRVFGVSGEKALEVS